MAIKSFTDLDVYQRAYRSAVIIMTKIIPNLPTKEKFDLADQLARSSKAIAPLIAEGFARSISQKVSKSISMMRWVNPMKLLCI